MGYKEMAMDAGYTGDEADAVAQQLEEEEQRAEEDHWLEMQLEDQAQENFSRLMREDWQELQNDIANWSTYQFPHQNPHSKITHLRSELVELDEDPTDVMEYADCFMLLIDTARLVGYDMSDIYKALREKLEINKNREWGEPDEHGVSYHIKDNDE